MQRTNLIRQQGLHAWLIPLSLVAVACRSRALYHSAGGVTIESLGVEVPCRLKPGSGGSFSFTGLHVSSSRGPIVRTLFELGIDRNDNEKLDPDEITDRIDNPNRGPEVTIGTFSGHFGPGERVIGHVEIYGSADHVLLSKTFSVEHP